MLICRPTDPYHEGDIEWYRRSVAITPTLLTNTLVASKVFSAMSGKMLLCADMMATYHVTVFDMLRMDIQATFFMIPQLIQGTSTLHNSRCSQS